MTSADERWTDRGLSVLLGLQGVTLFLVVPLNDGSVIGRIALDACHLAYALVCIALLTRRRIMQAGLLISLALLVGGPVLAEHLRSDLALGEAARHEVISTIAFLFNGSITALVARHVFASGGRVTAHRVRGAILLYLNVAALFAIVYGVIAINAHNAFAFPHGGSWAGLRQGGTAVFSYFSLTTITTTGFGDVVPLSPMARSLANLESVFGQLFPATLLARLVALHLTHEHHGADERDG